MGGPGPDTASRAPTCTVPVFGVTLGQVLAKRSGCSEGVDSGVRRQGTPPTLAPPPPTHTLCTCKGGLRGHPQQALPSHLRPPRAGRSQFRGPWRPAHLGRTCRRGQGLLSLQPSRPVRVGVVRSGTSPTATSGRGAERRWGRAPATRMLQGPGRGGGGAGPRRVARRTHRTLAATEDMASLLSALLREATAPMVEAAAHPQASERAPRPPPPSRVPRRAEDWDQARAWARARTRDPHGSSGALRAPRSTGQNGQARGWRSAHRDVREVEAPPTWRQSGAGLSEAPPAPQAVGGAGDPLRGAGPTGSAL